MKDPGQFRLHETGYRRVFDRGSSTTVVIGPTQRTKRRYGNSGNGEGRSITILQSLQGEKVLRRDEVI